MKFVLGLLAGCFIGITIMYFGVTTGITIVSKSVINIIDDEKSLVENTQEDTQIKDIERANLLPNGYTYPSKGYVRGYAFLGACSNGKWLSKRHYSNLPDCNSSLDIPVIVKPSYNFFLHTQPELSSKRIGFMHAYTEVRLVGYEPLGAISDTFTIWMGEIEIPKDSLGVL